MECSKAWVWIVGQCNESLQHSDGVLVDHWTRNKTGSEDIHVVVIDKNFYMNKKSLFRIKQTDFNVPAHRSSMPQIQMIPPPSHWHWDNQSYSRPLKVNTNQGISRCQLFRLWLDLTGDSNNRPSALWGNALPDCPPLKLKTCIHFTKTCSYKGFYHLCRFTCTFFIAFSTTCIFH